MSKAKILMVTYESHLGDLIEEILSYFDYETQRHVVYSEATYREKIIEQVGIVKPDLLIVILNDSPSTGTVTDWKYLGPLHAVEELREHSNTSVLYVCGDESSDFSPEQRERIERTRPLGWLSMPFEVSDLITTVRSALELAAIERRYGTTKEDLENRLIKRTEHLFHTSHELVKQAFKRSKAAAAAIENDVRLQAIFDCSTDLMFIKDRSLKYLMVNPAMAEFMNKPASELINKTDEELYDKETANHFRSLESRVLQGESIEEEYSRHIHGEKVIFLESRIPLEKYRGVGLIVGLCGISKNISERRVTRNSEPKTDHNYLSRAMKECLKLSRKVAMTDTPVLLLGENGSGKDFVARYIHDHSRRSNGPFFDKNCATIGESTAESELFGHERGAFTGAHARKRGIVELAEGGTLLLNEIGELSLRLQAKLLTFLDTREFERVGGERKIHVNARIIFSTNRNLQAEVKQGNFREDLFYRLDRIPIVIPPLRERLEDIPILVQQLLERVAHEMGFGFVPTVDSEKMKELMTYPWPGNVRELRNVLERWLILSRGDSSESALPLVGAEPGTQDDGRSVFGLEGVPVSDPPRAIVSDITGAVASFHCQPIEVQRHHLRSIAERVCSCQPGTITFMEEILGISGESIRTELKKAGFEHEIPKHRPRKAIRTLLMPKIEKYLIENIGALRS